MLPRFATSRAAADALIRDFLPCRAAEDPVFILTAVLIISSPPAITLAQITQAASGDAFERLISKTIWVSYAVLVPPRESQITTVRGKAKSVD